MENHPITPSEFALIIKGRQAVSASQKALERANRRLSDAESALRDRLAEVWPEKRYLATPGNTAIRLQTILELDQEVQKLQKLVAEADARALEIERAAELLR